MRKEEAHEYATTTNEEFKVDDIHPPDPISAPAYILDRSESMDDSRQYSSLAHPIKRYTEDPKEQSPAPQDRQMQQSVFDQLEKPDRAMQEYQLQLMLLESQNKKRLHMARQKQDDLGRNPAPGQSGDQQAAAVQGQAREQ